MLDRDPDEQHADLDQIRLGWAVSATSSFSVNSNTCSAGTVYGGSRYVAFFR